VTLAINSSIDMGNISSFAFACWAGWHLGFLFVFWKLICPRLPVKIRARLRHLPWMILMPAPIKRHGLDG
jgi:hypothetical protein